MYYGIDGIGRMTMNMPYLDPFMDKCNDDIASFEIEKQPATKNTMDSMGQAIAVTSDCP